MGQKYKVFIRDNALVLTDNPFPAGTFNPNEHLDWEQVQYRAKLLEDSLEKGLGTDVWLHCKDINEAIAEMELAVKTIPAGGGMVRNAGGQYLMIFRRGKWDMPKGKAEPGENMEQTAVREVGEETGIFPLRIMEGPFITRHLYHERNGECAIKKSFWYLMETGFTDELKPQFEEDIEEARWFNERDLQQLRPNIFPSVVEVLDHFSGTWSTLGG